MSNPPKGYEHHYWAFCLHCKKPMWGMSRPGGPNSLVDPPQNMESTCPHCGSINVFRNSSQPVEVRCAPTHKPRLATCNVSSTRQTN